MHFFFTLLLLKTKTTKESSKYDFTQYKADFTTVGKVSFVLLESQPHLEFYYDPFFVRHWFGVKCDNSAFRRNSLQPPDI